MADRRLYEFSAKWLRRFQDDCLVEKAVYGDSSFGEECEELGFQLDHGEGLIHKFNNELVYEDWDELEEIAEGIDDFIMLGSVVYSQWQFYRQCQMEGEAWGWDENSRDWFIAALSRLKQLSVQDVPLFSGTPKAMRLVSNCICYDFLPKPEKVVEQHFSLNADGKAEILLYRYADGIRYELEEKRELLVKADWAVQVLSSLGTYFSNSLDKMEIDDGGGDWELSLENERGESFTFCGSLFSNESELDEVSPLIRNSLSMPDLLLFDGEAAKDRIESFQIQFQHIRKEKPQEEEIAWDYTEVISANRVDGILEHIQYVGDEKIASEWYHVPRGVTALLDRLYDDGFLEDVQGTPSDVMEKPEEMREYMITAQLLYGGKKAVSGVYDQNNLPRDFPRMAQQLLSFLRGFSAGEILNPAFYTFRPRTASDLIICNVTFEKYGKTYCYLTEDDTLKAGDRVIVPAGRENRESIVMIDSVEYCPKEKPPFPLDKLKRVIRKCTEEDLARKSEGTEKL